MRVRHMGGDQFAIDVGRHTVIVDQPVDDGGEDAGPTPTELFVAGLAGCVAHYARRFLARHELDDAGLEVTASYTLGGRPVRVTDIGVHVRPPRSLPAERRDAFLAVASHCTVHNSLTQPPAVTVDLDPVG
jgi:uncharacterized OsmC-like protein